MTRRGSVRKLRYEIAQREARRIDAMERERTHLPHPVTTQSRRCLGAGCSLARPFWLLHARQSDGARLDHEGTPRYSS